MYPERDWSWICRLLAGIPEGRAKSRQRKQPRLRHSLKLLELGLSLLVGGRITIFPDPNRNVVAAMRGYMLGLIQALDDVGAIRFLLGRNPDRLAEFKKFMLGLRKLGLGRIGDTDAICARR